MIVKRYYGLMSYDYILPCCTTIAPNSYDYRVPCRTTWEPYKHDSLIVKIITLWFSAPFLPVLVFNICTQIIFSWKYRNFSKENIKRISGICSAISDILLKGWTRRSSIISALRTCGSIVFKLVTIFDFAFFSKLVLIWKNDPFLTPPFVIRWFLSKLSMSPL